MAPQLAAAIRACCVAVAISAVVLRAADSKAPSLMGATREQVLTKLGEPKSHIVAGTREVLFFARQRIVLRENVVIEVEQLAAEAPRRPPAPPVEPTPAAAASAPSSAASAPAPAGAAVPVATSLPPTEKVVAPAVETPAASHTTAEPVHDADAPLVIKSVRPAGSTAPRVTPASTTSAGPAAAAKVEAAPAPAAAAPVAVEPAPTESPRASEPSAPSAIIEAPTPPKEASKAPEPSAEVIASEVPVAVAPTKAAKSKPVRSRVRGEVELPEQKLVTTQSYVIAFGVLASVAYLYWRRRQRMIELAATTVSRTPFASPTTTNSGARFTAELLSKLEWKRLEELVASYYSKTGVVAVRTKTGPASPVHVRISWKGEPRPFACVQCIAHPRELIDAKPLQELFQVLTTEDIRRGYVVSTGKFNVGARDFAEEKHITLLSGEIFLEKLNALPDTARNELMQEITTGDYTTPSCPKCEAKMVRSPDDPNAWRCAEHADLVVADRV